MRITLIVLLAGLGCGSEKQPEHHEDKPAIAAPLRIVFGDCAGPSVTWVSGPRPLPFTREPAAGKPPPSPPPVDDPVQTAEDREARRQAIEQARSAGLEIAPVTGPRPSFEPSAFDDRTMMRGLYADDPTGNDATWAVKSPPSPTIAGSKGTVGIGPPDADSGLDRNVIRRYIRRNIEKIKVCFEKQRVATPGLAGTVQTHFTITPSGGTEQVEATGLDPDVASCIASVIERIEFPPPRGGVPVAVNYPFSFQAEGTPDNTTPVVAAAAAPITRGTYRDGSANPLRAAEPKLASCLGQLARPYGALVVELTYDASGHARAATVHGLDDDHARACVAAAVASIARVDATVTAERCPLAYGTLPLADAPAIDITAMAIDVLGKRATRLDAIAQDPSPLQIPEVTELLEPRVRALLGPGAPVVALHGPGVIRPIETTPMKIVNRVLVSALAAGDDFVLATKRGADWQLLRPVVMPVVPVPVGTGGTWNPRRGPRADGDRVVLSVLVTLREITLGISRINELQIVARDPDQAQKLASALAEHKASPLFHDRIDLELAADGDVPYRDLVTVIDAVTAAGFTAWRITDPQGLSAGPR